MITHTIESYWIPRQKKTKSKLQIKKIRQNFKNFEFRNGHYTRHTFWSCLIRCANMKLIRWVLLKIQSGHDSVHRRTDGQMDTVIPVYPPFNFVEVGGIKIAKNWNFDIWQKTLHATHVLKLLGKMYKYEMGPTRTVGTTEQTYDAGRAWDRCGTDGWTEWSQYIPQQLRCAGGVIILAIYTLA